ncbi:hypothetical protein LCGC14_2371210 [marine sediment metagenome]|uniref:Uncharacterized protein n=1 Tax=marine sediment metagenome TaxID=412755 RepID=A0A0F9C3Q1_9ZZZZ
MHTKISAGNPHGCNRYGFAWEHIPAGAEAHLDFGCSDGRFLESLQAKSIRRLVGVDIASEAIQRGRQARPGLELHHVRSTVPVPFPDRAFDSISVLDVLEHVYEQKDLLRELHRKLKDDGVLIVTVPRQHIFSFLDLGNLKFLFPRLHRWHYIRHHSRAEYEQRYVAHPDGLVGDVSAKKRWHEHFSQAKIRSLLEQCGFGVIEFDGAGFIQRPVNVAGLLLARFRVAAGFLHRIVQADARHSESMNLFCVARKMPLPSRRKGEP